MAYIEIVQNNHSLVGQVRRDNFFYLREKKNSLFFFSVITRQVHSDFQRQFLDLTIDKLLEQFVLNKYTGLEKPGE
jgi:hypothetical protein